MIVSFVDNVKYSFLRKSDLSFVPFNYKLSNSIQLYNAFMKINNIECFLLSLCDFDFADNNLFFVFILKVIFTTNIEVLDSIDGLLKQTTY